MQVTVSELIQQLEKLPADAKVVVEANVLCELTGVPYVIGDDPCIVALPID